MVRDRGRANISFGPICIPVKMHSGFSKGNPTELNRICRDCGTKLNSKMICPNHGIKEYGDWNLGYEVEDGKYIILTPEQVKQLEFEGDSTIHIKQFSPANELPEYIIMQSYVLEVDEGSGKKRKVNSGGRKAFSLLREALKEENKVGIGEVQGTTHTKMVAIRANDNKLLLQVIAFKDMRKEVPDTAYPESTPSASELELAKTLIQKMTKPFAVADETIIDKYEERIQEIIKGKPVMEVLSGKIESSTSQNLEELLKASIAAAETSGANNP